MRRVFLIAMVAFLPSTKSRSAWLRFIVLVGDSELDAGAAFGNVTEGDALGKGGRLLHDAEDIVLKVVPEPRGVLALLLLAVPIVLKVVPESRGVLAVLLLAVSTEETARLAPIITFDGTDGVDFDLRPYMSGYSRRRSFIWMVFLAASSSLKPA